MASMLADSATKTLCAGMASEARSGNALMKVLLVGHGCAPNRGSEPGVTWNWAINLAEKAKVWVITHEFFRPAIEEYVAEHPVDSLHFAYVGRVGWWDPLRLPSQRFIRFHYMFWQRRVLELARELDGIVDFDLIHHISWGTVSAPPLLWKLRKPFIWGPVGGGQTAPFRMISCYGTKIPTEFLRTLRINMLPFLPAVRQAVASTTTIFAGNPETASVLRRAGAGSVLLFHNVGVPQSILTQPLEVRSVVGPFIVLWVGGMIATKGISLCLRVAHATKSTDVRFIVVGDGPQAGASRRLARRLRLNDRVEFKGQLPWRQVQTLFRSAHVCLLTSIRDTFPTSTMEALAGGTPVICIDQHGVGAHLPESATVKVPVGRPTVVATAMAQAIESLSQDRGRLAAMSCEGRRYAESQSWERRTDDIHAHYDATQKRHAQAGRWYPGQVR